MPHHGLGNIHHYSPPLIQNIATKTKVITLTNYNQNQSNCRRNYKGLKFHEADAKQGKTCANESRLVWFTSDWMKKWREFFALIVQHSDGKPITFRH